jgi:hypothetical protein
LKRELKVLEIVKREANEIGKIVCLLNPINKKLFMYILLIRIIGSLEKRKSSLER